MIEEKCYIEKDIDAYIFHECKAVKEKKFFFKIILY